MRCARRLNEAGFSSPGNGVRSVATQRRSLLEQKNWWRVRPLTASACCRHQTKVPLRSGRAGGVVRCCVAVARSGLLQRKDWSSALLKTGRRERQCTWSRSRSTSALHPAPTGGVLATRSRERRRELRSILATAVLGLIAILGGWAHDEAARAADQRALCLCEYSRTSRNET